MKKVSLILSTYNCKDNLKKTFSSIDTQDYPNIEVCIADSCSTDGTIDLIKDYELLQKSNKENNLPYREVRWVSKKDSGIYEGLNNSIGLATGDYIQIMNDTYTCPEAISLLVSAVEKADMAKQSSDTYITGSHSDLVYSEGDKVIRTWKMGDGTLRSGWMPAHPTMMLKRDVYERYGLYDTSYVSAADYEFIVRILKDKSNRIAYVPHNLVSMFYGGTSSGGLYNYWRSISESLRALRENKVRFGLGITLLRTIRVALQFIKK